MTSLAVSYAQVLDATKRLAGLAHRTPIMTCSYLDRLAERSLVLKCEQFQKVGAFKFRGAANAIFKLTEQEAARGVATHSSGNHAQAVALAAKLRNIPAHIVMPRTAPRIKKQAVEHYGGRVTECEPTLEARDQILQQILTETGAIFIPPYNHIDVIAGQGTLACELLEQAPDLDAIIAPISGGGLISGICVGAKGCKPGVRIFAAEPLGANDAARSKAAGKLLPPHHPHTIADGLLAGLGDLTWPYVRDEVEAVFTVSEDDIVNAMRLCWERAKLLIEPSAAVPLAAVLSEPFRMLAGIKKVGVVLSGGNLDLDHLPW